MFRRKYGEYITFLVPIEKEITRTDATQLEKYKIYVDSLKENPKKEQKIINNNKLILKPHHRFRSEKFNVFTEEVNKIALTTYNEKRIQSIDPIGRYECGTSKDLACKPKSLNVTIQ